ncbi:WD40 repeat domain-containing protein [Portibacter marinus]|uniref:WD40 repeat domain-containing protein n=1 Tax=Portibacter marinus TaxID=2898660 RepID=UPI001F310B57|nr:hypothetical protein [Portibacter marinus]
MPCILAAQEEDHTIWTTRWSPNGKFIASGGQDGTLRIIDTDSMKVIYTFSIGSEIISRVSWHPTEDKLAIVAQGIDFTAKILDLNTWKYTGLQNLNNTMRAIDWTPDGKRLAVSHLEDSVSIFKNDGEWIRTFKADEKGVTDLDWHPYEEGLITVGSEINYYDFNMDSLFHLRSWTRPIMLLCVEWHKSGHFFIFGDYGFMDTDVHSNDKSLWIYDFDHSKTRSIYSSDVEFRNIRWNPDYTMFASASDQLTLFSKEGEVLFQSISNDGNLWGVDWSPDGKYIVTGSSNGQITIWNHKAEKIKQMRF